jgi:cytochrome c oxidase assembly protein subunit 15
MTYTRLLSLLLVLVYLLIILGGATRVFEAGVSCPDWPHCYGVWWPWPESAVPGGYVVNGMHFVWEQVALEWSHRGLAAIVGVLFVGLVGYSFMRPRREWLPLAVTMGLLAVQAGLGGLTVLAANVPWSVAVHLAVAMLVFGGLVWLRREAAGGGKPKPPKVPRNVRIFVVGLAALVWVLMSVGALVSSSHAGGICGGLASCGGAWWPADAAQDLHMLHRYLALAVLLVSGAYLGIAKRRAPALQPAARHLHLMVWGQVALGIATLYSFADYPQFYQPLSLAHLAWGTLVWLAALGNVMFLFYGKAGRFHGRG